MATVSLLNVAVRNNPAQFTSPYEFEASIQQARQPPDDELTNRVDHVRMSRASPKGSRMETHIRRLRNLQLTPTSSEHDQELDSLLVGPIPVGVNKFVFEADPPNTSRIPATEILGVTVILLSCSYDDREFVRVGYYVNNEYLDEALAAEPPAKPVIEKVRRNILAEKPRVTRFAIKWDSEESAPAEFPPEQPEADGQEADGATYGAEEEEEEGGVEVEAAGEAAAPAAAVVKGEDAEMEGVEANGKEEDEESEAGSEDIGDESEDDEEEDLEDEEGEGDGEGEANGDHDMEMDDGPKEANGTANHAPEPQHQADVMVH
ncbi:Histone chaperone asf1 [Vermiconidia calcicola]|uniref:Histone chaperone asf1 n=1 Tax=Vermiconidia calcicola TaxID=1690605 RepID=A0ACC3NMI9_9PEZI|nr:Histone chaperone asf1 [Vermiconidia calcicola]